LFEHVWPLAQVPQFTDPLHPSVAMPQLNPRCGQVVVGQTHVLFTHVWPFGQASPQRPQLLLVPSCASQPLA
jgi:hypothetical protein